MLASPEHPEEARGWLIAAAILGLFGALLLDRPAPAVREHIVPRSWNLRAPRRVSGFALLGVGSICSLVAMLRVPQPDATWIWGFGLALVIAGSILVTRRPYQWRIPRVEPRELGALLVILAGSAWLRMPQVDRIPPNVHGDEAAIGLGARDLLAGRAPLVFGTGWFDVPNLSFALPAASMRLFGDDLTGLRMSSAIEGVASVLVLYLLARRLWGVRPALLAAAFMGAAAWHVHFSRTGFHYMQATLATLLVLYALVRGLQERRAVDFVLCGFAIGLCFEVYYAARIAPLLGAIYVAYRGVRERGFFRAHLPGLAALVLGTVVFLLPMVSVYVRSPASFASRAQEVLIFSAPSLQHEQAAYNVATAGDVLRVQVARTLEAFNVRGETSLQYGHPAPLLDPWTGALVVIGCLGFGLRPGSANGMLLAAWIWLTLVLGSVFTVDALFSPRVVPVIPALAVLPALVLDRAWTEVGRLGGRFADYAFGAVVLVLTGLALQANIHDYFDIQVTRRQPADRFTLLGYELANLRGEYPAVVIGREDFTSRYETPRFLAPNADAIDVRDGPLPELPLGRAAFILEVDAPNYIDRLQALRAAYPDARTQIFGTPPVLVVLLVDD